jgi:hypothetical protein
MLQVFLALLIIGFLVLFALFSIPLKNMNQQNEKNSKPE